MLKLLKRKALAISSVAVILAAGVSLTLFFDNQTPPADVIAGVPGGHNLESSIKLGASDIGATTGEIPAVSARTEMYIKDIEGGKSYKLLVNFKEKLVDSYSIFRDYKGNGSLEFGLRRHVYGLSWEKYPPIDLETAKQLIVKAGKLKSPSATFGDHLFHFRNSMPAYAFSESGRPVVEIFFVDAENGNISIVDRSLSTEAQAEQKEIEDSKIFLRRYNYMSDGYMRINKETWLELTQEQRNEMEKATSETNKLIAEGRLVIDSDFTIVFDNR